MLHYFHNRPVPRNVWLGVSVENRQFIYRIDVLKQIKASIRFISFVGPVGILNLKGIHWAIVCGESGKKPGK